MTDKFIHNLLKDLSIPDDCLLVLHVKLKAMKSKTNKDYKTLTKEVLKFLIEEYNPRAILVPTFTYSFIKSGVFHLLYSKSETGRFSEETRANFTKFRTKNPLFSFADINGYFRNINLDNTKAFGRNTIFAYLDDKRTVNINIGLDRFICSQLHHIEKLHDVSYRFNRKFEGYMYLDKKIHRKIEFNYFMRDLEEYPKWDRKRIKEKLLSENKLCKKIYHDIEVNWINSRDLKGVISEKLQKDDDWLLNK